MTTIREALHDAALQIAAISDTASLDAQILLGEILQCNRAYLLAYGDKTLTPEQSQRFTAFVERRSGGEPIAYILGHKAFYDREFIVTPDVLIPRPETELLLEQALAFAHDLPGCVVADIGTGSGALAITFAATVPQAQVYAVDISPQALAVARRNAELHQANVTFYEGDLLRPLIDHHIRLNLLMANLPYIAADDLPQLAVSKHEPWLALDGGPDGLDLVHRLLADVPQVCSPGALVLLEIGADQGEAALMLAQTSLSTKNPTILQDYARLDRILRFETP